MATKPYIPFHFTNDGMFAFLFYYFIDCEFLYHRIMMNIIISYGIHKNMYMGFKKATKYYILCSFIHKSIQKLIYRQCVYFGMFYIYLVRVTKASY